LSMPRSARIVFPHTPHHIVQRGHNRQTVFVSDDDYNYYRENLIYFKHEFGCRIYLSLGDTAQERRKAYEEDVLATLPDYELKLIREMLQRGQLTGGDHFRKEFEKELGIRISNKKQGRPRKKK